MTKQPVSMGGNDKKKRGCGKKMRKRVIIAAAASAVIGLATGCAGASANQAETTSAETAEVGTGDAVETSESENGTKTDEQTQKDGEKEGQYGQRLEPEDPVDGEVAAAAGALGQGDVADSPYFKAIDYYNGSPSDTLVLLDHFKTYQQTSDRSCGAACVLMTLNYLEGSAPGENALDKEMDIRYVDNKREDGSYGATTASVAKALTDRGYEVQTSADTQDADGYSFYSEYDLADFITEKLKAGKPILTESSEWGGHWMVLIGYDNMGTDVMYDDVLVFADPYDTSDHCQDGYYTISFERYVSQWFDYQVMGENERYQQYVTLK